MMKHIVKRAGHTEPYDEKKVYGSVFAACLAVKVREPEAELIAQHVMEAVNHWIEKEPRVTAHHISREVIKTLKYYNSDASYLYEHHHDLS